MPSVRTDATGVHDESHRRTKIRAAKVSSPDLTARMQPAALHRNIKSTTHPSQLTKVVICRLGSIVGIIVHTVRMCRNGRTHGRDLLRWDASQSVDRVDTSLGHLVQVEADSRIANPRTPVPWPLEELAGVKQDGDAAEQQRVEDACSRDAVSDRSAGVRRAPR